MAHIAAVLPHLKNAGVPTHDHADASDGDFAAVLAALTPKTELQDAKPHVAQPHHAEPKQEAPALETRKSAPKIVRHVAPSAQKGDVKIALPLKSRVPDKPGPGLPRISENLEDEAASAVAPVRAPAQARLIDKSAPEIDPDTGHPVLKAASPENHPPDTASHASRPVPKVAPPVQDAPDIAAAKSAPILKAMAPERDEPAPTGTKVSQDVVDKIVAEAKTPATVADLSKLVQPKPADKTAGKPDAKIQAAVAKANVVVIDRTPPPAPQVADKAAPQPQPDTRIQPHTEQIAGEPEAAAPQAPSVQPDAPAPQPAANIAAVVASHPAPAPQIATEATPAPAAPEPRTLQPNVAALAAAIAAKSGQGSKMFEIRLDPPELGRVDVHLSVSHDGKAEATLYADRPETVALLRGDSQNLERALKDAGLDVSNSSLNFSLKGEQRQGDGGGASSAHTRNLSHAVVARSEAVNASLANLTQASADGRLDIRV